MSESRLTIDRDSMPAGYEKLDGPIEIVTQKDGSIRFNSILTLGEDNALERKVQLPDLGEIWGFDPKERERYINDPEGWDREQRLSDEIRGLKERVQLLEATLSKKDTDSTDESEKEPIEPKRSRWERVTGRIGSIVIGAHATATTKVVERGSREVRREFSEEEIKDDYTDSETRTGKIAIGAVAVAAAVGVGSYLLGRHTGHNVYEHVQSNSGNNGHGVVSQVSQSGEHTAYFKNTGGHALTGVELPKNLSLKTVSGHNIIVDSKGRTVVGVLRNGIADRLDNLSRRARAILRAKGYVLYQGGFPKHFKTFVENR